MSDVNGGVISAGVAGTATTERRRAGAAAAAAARGPRGGRDGVGGRGGRFAGAGRGRGVVRGTKKDDVVGVGGGGGGEDGKWGRASGVVGRAAIEDGRRAAYNAAINVCGRAGRWDRAVGLLEVREGGREGQTKGGGG